MALRFCLCVCVSLSVYVRFHFCLENFCCMLENFQQMEKFFAIFILLCVRGAIPYFPNRFQKPKKTFSITFNLVIFQRNFTILLSPLRFRFSRSIVRFTFLCPLRHHHSIHLNCVLSENLFTKKKIRLNY